MSPLLAQLGLTEMPALGFRGHSGHQPATAEQSRFVRRERTPIAAPFPPKFLHRNRMLPMKLWRVTPRRPYRSRGPQTWAAERTRLQIAGFRMMAEREAERREFAQRRIAEFESAEAQKRKAHPL